MSISEFTWRSSKLRWNETKSTWLFPNLREESSQTISRKTVFLRSRFPLGPTVRWALLAIRVRGARAEGRMNFEKTNQNQNIFASIVV